MLLCLAFFQDKIILSDKRLYIIIRLGYNNVKFNPVTECLFSSLFTGEKIYVLENDPDSFCLHIIVLIKIPLYHTLVLKKLQTFILIAK